MGWDEDSDKFVFGTTSASGSVLMSITPITYQTVKASTFEGALSGNATTATNLSGSQTANYAYSPNGSSGTDSLEGFNFATDIPTLNQNTTGATATVLGAAQTAITSVGTHTALQVDNVNIGLNTVLCSSSSFDLKLSAQSGKKVHIDSDLKSGNDTSFNIIAVQNVLSFNENLNSQLGWINKNSQGNSVPIYFFIAVAGSNHLNIYSEGFPNSDAKFNYKDAFEIMSTNLSVLVMLGLKKIYQEMTQVLTIV